MAYGEYDKYGTYKEYGEPAEAPPYKEFGPDVRSTPFVKYEGPAEFKTIAENEVRKMIAENKGAINGELATRWIQKYYGDGSYISVQTIANSGVIDKVRIHIPTKNGEGKKKRIIEEVIIKEEEKTLTSLVFFLWVNDDAEGKKRIRLWDANLNQPGEVIANNLAEFYPDVDEKYIIATDCSEYDDDIGFGYGLGKAFFSQLEYSRNNFSLKELVSIEDLYFSDNSAEVYIDAWRVGTNNVKLRDEDDINTIVPESIVAPGWDYLNEWGRFIYWSFDDEDSGYKLLYPSDGIYTLIVTTNDTISDGQIEIARYKSSIDDWETLKILKTGEYISTYISSKKIVAVRTHVATGSYWFGQKYADPETYDTYTTLINTGFDVSSGGPVCMAYENYKEGSCYAYWLKKETRNYSHVEELTNSSWATDSSGDYSTSVATPLPSQPYPQEEYFIFINDPYDGERSYLVETIPERTTSDIYDFNYVYLKIYNYGGEPLYTYTVYSGYRHVVYYGYIYGSRHIKSEEFGITASVYYDYAHSFGEPVNGETIKTCYPDWNRLHAAILTTTEETKTQKTIEREVDDE